MLKVNFFFSIIKYFNPGIIPGWGLNGANNISTIGTSIVLTCMIGQGLIIRQNNYDFFHLVDGNLAITMFSLPN